MKKEPKVEISIPVPDLLRPFLYRWVGEKDFHLLSKVVDKTSDRSLLLHIAEKSMSRLSEIYKKEEKHFSEKELSETFNPTGYTNGTVRGYGTRAIKSGYKSKSFEVLAKMLRMVENGKKELVKIASIDLGKL